MAAQVLENGENQNAGVQTHVLVQGAPARSKRLKDTSHTMESIESLELELVCGVCRLSLINERRKQKLALYSSLEVGDAPNVEEGMPSPARNTSAVVIDADAVLAENNLRPHSWEGGDRYKQLLI